MQLSLQSIRNYVKTEIKQSSLCDDWFWDEHVSVVEKLAKELLKTQPSANVEIVLLSVYFHDLGRAYGIDDGHDVWGADFSKKYLMKHGFSNDVIEGVYHACLAHRVKEFMPESIEAKILATADALSHFENGFYLRIFYSMSKRMSDYHSIRERVLIKMDRDYNKKIFFEEAKKAVEPMYLSWKKVAGSIKWE